ncbi:MAG: methylamine utilization protein [Rubrivivax sp.]
MLTSLALLGLAVIAQTAHTAQTAQASTLNVQASDKAGKPLADVVVAVKVAGQRNTAEAGTVFQLAQKNRQFQPQLAVIQTGTAVNFPNFDTVRHHVYSFSPIKKFELKLYAGTPTAPVVFDQPGFAALGCNIHDGMLASVVVVDTPFFGKTDAAGKFSLELPPGDHELLYWHNAVADNTQWARQRIVIGNVAAQVTLTPVLAAP